MQHRAASYRIVAIAAGLLAATAAVSADQDALHRAVEQGDPALVRSLLAEGVGVDLATRNGVTPLALAALNGDSEMIELLIGHGADPDTLSSEGESALMLAALNGRPEAVALLLDHGADPNFSEPFRGQTALMWAAGDGNAEAVSLLLGRGAELEAKSTAGFSALLFAVRNAELESLAVLLAAGANANVLAPDDTSALNVAIVNGYFEVAATLLTAGANPNLPDARGSPLHTIGWLRKPGATGTAAVGGEADAPVRPSGRVTSLELARQLLDAGADPNVRIDWEEARFNKLGGTARNPPGLTLGRHLLTYNGATPFYVAAKNGDVEYMRLLAEHGADALQTSRYGITPLMVAAGLDTWEGETPGAHPCTHDAGETTNQRVRALTRFERARLPVGDDASPIRPQAPPTLRAPT
jgi:ankyrin repeat protein